MAEGAGARIAVVDDDDAVRASTRRLLLRAGYGVDVYDGGATFLDEALQRRHDCVLLDLRMPGVDGLSVLRALSGAIAPVIVLTGHGDAPLALEAMRLGAETMLEKPYRLEDMLSAICQAIEAPRRRPA